MNGMPGVTVVGSPLHRGRRWSLLATVAALAAILLFAVGILLVTGDAANASPTNSDGSLNCKACHSNPNFEILRLADGTHLALTESAPLCAQCHPARYQAWASGTHGFPGFRSGSPASDPSTSTSCTTCHNPHEPRIALKDITKPHPEPVGAPPSAPTDLVMILGISLGVVGVGFALSLINRRNTP
jgi:hypothetical protein